MNSSKHILAASIALLVITGCGDNSKNIKKDVAPQVYLDHKHPMGDTTVKIPSFEEVCNILTSSDENRGPRPSPLASCDINFSENPHLVQTALQDTAPNSIALNIVQKSDNATIKVSLDNQKTFQFVSESFLETMVTEIRSGLPTDENQTGKVTYAFDNKITESDEVKSGNIQEWLRDDIEDQSAFELDSVILDYGTFTVTAKGKKLTVESKSPLPESNNVVD